MPLPLRSSWLHVETNDLVYKELEQKIYLSPWSKMQRQTPSLATFRIYLSLGKNGLLNLLHPWPELFMAIEETNAGVPAEDRVIVARGAYAFGFLEKMKGFDKPIVHIPAGSLPAHSVYCFRTALPGDP
jgi:hypothetical protein